ncbi:MAG: hypothetical protein AAF573_07485 [Bacteroidota bacterium]
MKNILFLVTTFMIFSCKSQPKLSPLLELSKDHKVVFLDSIAAGIAISKDDKEHYFTQVNKLDMSIQMGKNYATEVSKDAILKDYVGFLKNDVLDFSKEEMEFVNGVFKEAYALCNKVSTNIFPKEIKLIKTHGNHYGDGAYYTRESCIVIPKNELEKPNRENFLETMLHEISHIYTRYHPEKRKALYELIGFKSLGDRSNLLIKDGLNDKILLNPDGINFAYFIDLKERDGRPYSAVPIIFSKEKAYKEYKKDFFQYLDFSLYKIRINHSARVISDAEGNSTVKMNDVPDFFEQITDNTDYIIHPDEIIADNFMYVVLRGKKGGLNQEFSEAGLALLKNIQEVLQED